MSAYSPKESPVRLSYKTDASHLSRAFATSLRSVAHTVCRHMSALPYRLRCASAPGARLASIRLVTRLNPSFSVKNIRTVYGCFLCYNLKVFRRGSQAATTLNFHLVYTSRIRESDPPLKLGKLAYYRCTNPAFLKPYCIKDFRVCQDRDLPKRTVLSRLTSPISFYIHSPT